MRKEIICVYQDCVLCGDRGRKLKKVIISKKLNVRKVSFASPEGRHLIHEAVFGGNKVEFPLFTDGTKFSTNLEDFYKRTPKNTRKVRIKGDNK